MGFLYDKNPMTKKHGICQSIASASYSTRSVLMEKSPLFSSELTSELVTMPSTSLPRLLRRRWDAYRPFSRN